MRIELGLPVECDDGPSGSVTDVVIDPHERSVTHLVVEPYHRHDLARLVPIGDLDPSATGPALHLRGTCAAFERYPRVEERAFVRLGEWPRLDERWDIGVTSVLSPPFGAVLGDGDVAMYRGDGALLAVDRIPPGDVELRRGSIVEAGDGTTVGRVDGFVVDADGRVSHLVLERGHLWHKRSITVPMTAVRALHTDRVELDLSVDEIGALPDARTHGVPATP